MATPQEVEAFVNKIGPMIRKEVKERGYLVSSPIIAQACCESAFGTSSLAYKYHNYFGMKCGSSWKGKSVNLKTKEEYTAGVLTTIRDNFRVYDSLEEGVIGYFNFINTKRYANLREARTPQQYLEYIKADGYATSSSYVATNLNIINKYNLTRFDEVIFKPITPDLISNVIMGVFGNGALRQINLRNEGYDPAEVQNKVNELYKLSKELEPFKKKCGDYFDCVLKFFV